LRVFSLVQVEADRPDLARRGTLHPRPFTDTDVADQLCLCARRDGCVACVKAGGEFHHDRADIVIGLLVGFMREIERRRPVGMRSRGITGGHELKAVRDDLKRFATRLSQRNPGRHDQQNRHEDG
jgi:hypothetical protein